MSVNKSIIENFELSNGTEIYVQVSMMGKMSLSFDSNSNNVQHTMTIDEAEKLATTLNQVIKEARDNGKA